MNHINKFNNRSLLLLAVVFIMIVCLNSTGCAKKEGEVKIGAIFPITGSLAIVAEYAQNGLNLATEDINASGGVKGQKIKLVIQDSQGETSKSVSIFQMFHNVEKVGVVFVPTTNPVYAVKPLAEKYKVVLIAQCMDPTVQEDSKMVFRLYESMAQEAATILEYFKKETQPIRVALLYVRHPGTEQEIRDFIKPGLEKMNIKVVVEETYTFADKDFKPTIAKIKNRNPTHLLLIGYGVEYPPIMKTLEELKLLEKIRLVGGWGFFEPHKVPAELLEGVVVAAPRYIFEKNEKALKFAEKYQKRHGQLPHFEVAISYDGLMLVAEAMKKAKSLTPEDIADALGNLREFEGVLGKITVSQTGDMQLPMGIGIFRKGIIVPLF